METPSVCRHGVGVTFEVNRRGLGRECVHLPRTALRNAVDDEEVCDLLHGSVSRQAADDNGTNAPGTRT